MQAEIQCASRWPSNPSSLLLCAHQDCGLGDTHAEPICPVELEDEPRRKSCQCFLVGSVHQQCVLLPSATLTEARRGKRKIRGGRIIMMLAESLLGIRLPHDV